MNQIENMIIMDISVSFCLEQTNSERNTSQTHYLDVNMIDLYDEKQIQIKTPTLRELAIYQKEINFDILINMKAAM